MIEQWRRQRSPGPGEDGSGGHRAAREIAGLTSLEEVCHNLQIFCACFHIMVSTLGTQISAFPHLKSVIIQYKGPFASVIKIIFLFVFPATIVAVQLLSN